MRPYAFFVLALAGTVSSHAQIIGESSNLRRRMEEVPVITGAGINSQTESSVAVVPSGKGATEMGPHKSQQKVASLWDNSRASTATSLRSGSGSITPPPLWAAASGDNVSKSKVETTAQEKLGQETLQETRQLKNASLNDETAVSSIDSISVKDDSKASEVRSAIPVPGQLLSGSSTASSPGNFADHGTSRRKFVSYQSSEWENLWLKRGGELNDDRKICKTLLEDQIDYLRDYLKLLCTSKLGAPYSDWCVIDDGFAALWYNHANKEKLELTFERPVPLIVDILPQEAIVPGPAYEHILSKLTYRDEVKGVNYDEYIEPLVGQLRFPLQKCVHPTPITPQYKNHYLSFRGFILPPPPVVQGDKAIYFDAASNLWESRRGGASPKFVSDTWKQHGVVLDNIWVINKGSSREDFFQDIPADLVDKINLLQCDVASKPELHSEEHPYLPRFINEHATVNDYVILQVDLSNLEGRFKHLAYLDSEENLVDELIWDHKAQGMFLTDDMLHTDLTLDQTYEMFIMMRRKGIRAHAMM